MPRHAEIRSPKRILIMRLGAIGDVLLATPVIRALRGRFPESRIDFLTKEAYIGLLKAHPGLTGVIGFPPDAGLRGLRDTVRLIRGRRYDAVVDLQNNIRSRLFVFFSGSRITRTVRLGRFRRFLLVRLRMDRYHETVPVPVKYLLTVRDLGAEDDGKGLDLAVDAAVRKSVRALLERTGIGSKTRIVALAPGAGRSTKRWPAERFAEAGRSFADRRYRIVILGGPKDADVCSAVKAGTGRSAVSFCASASLAETAALLERSALLVTNDTGVMHMASALDIPTVAVFGPTTRHFGFFPFRSAAVVLERDLPCRPCSFHGTERCPEVHFNCMRTISSDDAVSAAERLLETE
jgi:heptosyltransferase-2